MKKQISGWGAHLRKRVQTPVKSNPNDVSLTKQADKAAADINNIVKKYANRADEFRILQMANQGAYDDFSEVPSFLEAQNILLKTQEQFAALPSSLRDELGNDPARFLEYVADSKNSDELIKLGLKKAPVAPPEPVRVIVENPDKPQN